MKYQFIDKIRYLMIAGSLFMGLTGCREELMEPGSYVAPGYGVLKLAVSSEKGATRAVGDLLPPDVTFDKEKEIHSIAFFVKTDADTKDGKTLAGTFARFYSDTDQADLALSEPLAKAGDGQYTCGIRVYSESWKNPKVIVIANYVENGLKTALENVKHWQELQDITTPDNAQPHNPLLMYGNLEELSYWTNNQGGLATRTISLERIVSRIDIHNKAFVKDAATGNTDGGFVLHSVTLQKPKAQSFLLPPTESMLNSIASATAGYETLTLTGDSLKEASLQNLDSLYVYENLNTDPDLYATLATSLKITGLYKGNPISKVIPLKDKEGKVIALKRNHRYVVEITKSDDPKEVKFNISAAEWAEGDSVGLMPQFKAPIFTNVSEGNTAWDGSKNTFTVPVGYAGNPGAIGFEVSSENQSFLPTDTIAVYKAAGDSVVYHSDILSGKITPDGAGITVSGINFTRKYQITPLPAKNYLGADKEPLYSIRLVYANSIYTEAADTLTIKYE